MKKLSILGIVLLIIGVITYIIIKPNYSEIINWNKQNKVSFSYFEKNKSKLLLDENLKQTLGLKDVGVTLYSPYPKDLSILFKIPRLISVRFDDGPPEDISVISKLPELKIIEIIDLSPERAIDIASLNFTKLEEFVCFTPIENINHLYKMKNLRELTLVNNEVEFSKMKDMTKLEVISMENSEKEKIKYQDLNNLNCFNLKNLYLEDYHVKDVKKLIEFKQLETLAVSFIKDPSDLKRLNVKERISLIEISKGVLKDLLALLKKSPSKEVIIWQRGFDNFFEKYGDEELNIFTAEEAFDIGRYYYNLDGWDFIALKFLRYASLKNHSRAMYGYGRLLLEDSKKEKGIHWLEKSIKDKNEAARTLLAIVYFDGSFGVKQNKELGLQMLEKGASNGYLKSAKTLVQIHLSKSAGNYNVEKAREWYKKYLKLGGSRLHYNELR